MQREEMIAKWENILQQLNNDGLEILDKCFGTIADSVRYTTMNEEKLQQFHEEEAAQKLIDAEKQAKCMAAIEERKEFEKTFRYSRNDTMKMLRHQRTYSLLGEDKISRQFDDIRSANRYTWNFNVALDAFSLGFICGKRKEREHRKERAAKGGK